MTSHLTSFTLTRATLNYRDDRVNNDEFTRSWVNFTNINAMECGLDLCVKKYSSKMEKTILTEELLDTFIDEQDRGSVAGSDGTPKGLSIQPPTSFTGKPDGDAGAVFTVENATMNAIRNMFEPLGGDTFWKGTVWTIGPDDVLYDSDMAKEFSKLDLQGMSTLMDSIAASMTKRMREAPVAGSKAVGLGSGASGILNQHVPFVNVRWAWITFPATLVSRAHKETPPRARSNKHQVLLALVFLLVTMVQNAKEGAMLWKSNSLANFYHPLTKDGRNELQNGDNADEAVEFAEKMKVKWARTEAGVTLALRYV